MKRTRLFPIAFSSNMGPSWIVTIVMSYRRFVPINSSVAYIHASILDYAESVS